MFTKEANAEYVAARAAELAIEQQARLDLWFKTHSRREEFDFYVQAVEVEASTRINNLLQHYAMLKGYIHKDQRLRVTRSATMERQGR